MPRPRLPSGHLACRECGGSDPERASCVRCGSTGAEPCAYPGCTAFARVETALGVFAYDTIEHAYADGNWASCVCCGAAPQRPGFEPWCGEACESRMLDAAYRNRLARWHAKLAVDEAAHAAQAEV